MSQMKEIMIAAVAVATLMSCQPNEKELLIDSKISEIDSKISRIESNFSSKDWEQLKSLQDRYFKGLTGPTRKHDLTDEELRLYYDMSSDFKYILELKKERENWVLQK
jgi:hypothetical protein